MITDVRSCGLNRIWGLTEPKGPLVAEDDEKAEAAATWAARAAKKSLPSTRSCGVPLRVLGVTTATTASPRRSQSTACARPSAGRVATTSKTFGRTEAACCAKGPTTTARTDLTSKLAA